MNTIKQDTVYSLIVVLQVIIILLILVGGGALYKSVHDMRVCITDDRTNQNVEENLVSGVTSSTTDESIVSTTSTTNTPTYSFDHQGVLIFNREGRGPDMWYLIYDTQSVYAQTIRVEFTNQSVCKNGQGTIISCGTNVQMNSGIRARIQGEIQRGVVVVAELTKLSE